MAFSKLASNPKKKRKLWSGESMLAAVKQVESGMGLREAARLYNVPCESLRRRVNGTVGLDCRPGPPTVLTKEEEDALVHYCFQMADMGFGLMREDVMRVAFTIVDHSGRVHPFTDGMAGRAWFDGFRARHPRLTLRSAQGLSYSRAASANEATIQDFFGKLGAVYARLNILAKPMQIFNVDETGVSVVHKPGKVVTEVGRKNVWSVTSAEKGKTHTILSCVSASGVALPPFMIYPRKRIPDHMKEGAVPGAAFHCSDNGWITQELYLQWFDFFLANIPPARPVLLIEDGHSSHITVEVIEKARSNGVHMLCLPAHTTHILQPLDVGVFKSLKAHYSKACKQYLAANPGRVVTTDVIASLLGKSWPQAVTPVNIMSGFRKTGVYPLNPGQITDRQTAPSKALCASEESSENSSASSPCGSTSTHASETQERLFQTRYEEGCDVYDAEYIAWLLCKHPESVPPRFYSLTSSTSAVKASCSATCSEQISSRGTCTSASSTSYLSEVLALPKPKMQKKKKFRGITSRAQCITDTEFLKKLEAKKQEKTDKQKAKEARKVEREKVKRMKEAEKELRKVKKGQKRIQKRKGQRIIRGQRKKGETESLVKHMQKLSITCPEGLSELEQDSQSESDAECPKCGQVYGEDESVWICCDSCNKWFDWKCSGLSDAKRIPDVFTCENCV